METGRSKEETFAPVLDWATIRLMFALSVQNKLHTQMIDFHNAFVQSTLPEPIYLELPPGGYWNLEGMTNKIFKVEKSLYCDRRAPRLWDDHCHKTLTLEKYSFQVDDLIDSCLFVWPGCVIILYVDNAIVIGENV